MKLSLCCMTTPKLWINDAYLYFLHTIFCTGEELPFIFLLCSLQQQVSIEKVQELNCTKIGFSEASNKQLFIQHLFSFINVTQNHSGQFTQYERDLGVL